MCSFAYVSAYDAHIFTGRVCPPDGRSSQDSTALGSGWNTHSEADSDRSARLHGRRSATGVGFSRSAEAIDCLLPGVERGPEAGSQEPKASAGTVLYLSRNRASRIPRRGRRGMNFKRKVFTELMDAVGRGEISKLIVAHKDRLVRFGFAWFSHFCEINGCELLVLNAETLSPQEEMVQDLMTIVDCFSSRLYGLRNYKKALKAAITQ